MQVWLKGTRWSTDRKVLSFGASVVFGTGCCLEVHARKSRVETVHASEVLSRHSFTVRYEGGPLGPKAIGLVGRPRRRRTFLHCTEEAGAKLWFRVYTSIVYRVYRYL